MKTFEEYSREVRKNIIDHWAKNGQNIAGLENDPVINLMLSAITYQAYLIHRDINQYDERIFRNLRDRTIPFNLTKPIPAFSIIETGLKPECSEKILDENCSFDFVNSKKQKISFAPLLVTKTINAKLFVEQIDNKICNLILELKEPTESLTGLSFYLDTVEPVEIDCVKINGKNLPLVKPSQFSELPFTEWFNNAHLFLNQNYYLFGTYDFWRELFLTNTMKLYYIGQYGKEISTRGETTLKLEFTFNTPVSSTEILKINCIPIVNVEKKEVTLDERNPVKDLSSDTDEFLNIICDNNVESNENNYFIRQHSIERYNSEQLFEQMQEMLIRFNTDYYAFQGIKELSSTDKMEILKEVMDDIREIVSKSEDKIINNHYYAFLKKNRNDIKRVNLKYLVTSGAAANGIKDFSKPTKSPIVLDNNKTTLLLDTRGGRNSITDEVQKEEISKYYFQTKDRLVTPSDITIYIKTFYHREGILGKEIESISINPMKDHIQISIVLKNDSYLFDTENLELLADTLQKKIMLRSSGILPFIVQFS